MNRIAVYCGSKKGKHPDYIKAAEQTGKVLLDKGIGMVYGGGHVGIMGVIANAVLAGEGEAIGVIPQKLVDFEVAHQGLTDLFVVKDMHQRKSMMIELSDAFLTLPGGIGTMEELFEVFTWQNIGYHNKPCGLLNVNHYYDPLLEMIDKMVDQGFLNASQQERLLVDTDPLRLVEKMEEYEASNTQI